MNTAARSVHDSVVTPKRLLKWFINRSQWLYMGLLLSVVLSALSVIYMTNADRMLNTQLQQAQAQTVALNTQWGQLLLEKGAWQSQSHIDGIAMNALNMVVPKNKHYILVNS